MQELKESNCKLIQQLRQMKEARENETERFRTEREMLIVEIDGLRDKISTQNRDHALEINQVRHEV